MMQVNDDRIVDQDKKIEVLSRVVGQTADVANDLKRSLDEQSPLIDNVKSNIDHTNIKCVSLSLLSSSLSS